MLISCLKTREYHSCSWMVKESLESCWKTFTLKSVFYFLFEQITMRTLLYVLDYYLPHKWGVETVFEQIINRSLQEGYEVIVLTSHYDSMLPQEENIWELKIIRTGKGRKAFIRAGFRKGIQVLRTFPEIVKIHTSTYWWAIPASLLGLFFRKPVLITVHEIFWKLRNRYKSWKVAWLYRFFEWFIFQLPFSKYHCVSLYTLNSLRLVYGISDEKLFLAYNGVDYDFWNRDRVSRVETQKVTKKFGLENKWNVLYFGHTGISKGIDDLVEAIPGLLNIDEKIQLIFNFIPAQREVFIKKKIQTLLSPLPKTARGRVKIRNGLPKEELRALVANVQVVVAPSLSEGFGSVHTETLAIGTPLITTRVASLPEVVWGVVKFIPSHDQKALVQAGLELYRGEISQLPKKYFSRDEQYQTLSRWYQEE